MKRTTANRLLPLALAASAALATSASAKILYWNPDPLDADWDLATKNWSLTDTGTADQLWESGDSANFTSNNEYFVTVDGDRTADAVHVAAGQVHLEGSNVIANSLTIDANATLYASGTRIAKTGITPVTANGTLDLSESAATGGRYIQLAGAGTVIGTFRYNGTSEFAGNIEDSSAPAAIVINAGTASNLILSGDNSAMTGDILIGLAGTTVTLASADALGQNVYLRFEGGGGAVALAAQDLTRAWATGSTAGGAGGIRFSGDSGTLYATGADRNFTLVTEAGGDTPAEVVWGLNGLEGSVGLGAPAATDTIIWTNDIDLNKGNRTIRVGNGDADVDAELSGVISGETTSKLTKSGAGTLLLSNANSHAGGTAIANSPGVTSALRISTDGALGNGALTIGGGGNDDRSRLEIEGGLTIENPVTGFASRNNDEPNIISLSGDNTITANLSSDGGGDRTTFQSDADTLTLAGTFNGRILNLLGEGNGEFTNAVTLTVGLVKRDDGTWTLSGGFTNPGPTSVEGGVLVVKTASFDDASAIDIGPDGILKLDFTGTDRIASLTLDGELQENGVYDSSNTGFLTGDGKLQVGPAAGGGFAGYLDNAGIPGEPATGDFDKDGIPNIVEYALGLDPKKSSVPAGTFDGTTLSFTKGADAIVGEDVNYIIETSTDLGISDPWTAVVTQTAPNSTGSISYDLPKTGPKLFARLKVVQVP